MPLPFEKKKRAVTVVDDMKTPEGKTFENGLRFFFQYQQCHQRPNALIAGT